MTEAEFIDLLKASQRQLQRGRIDDFRRRVGFGDLVTERSTNATECGFGPHTTCYDSVLVLGDVVVGDHCWIGPSCVLDGTGGLTLGDWVTVSFGAMLASHSTVSHMLTAGRRPVETRRTVVGSRTIIGPGAFIGMGLHIGDCCVVAPHAVVTRNVPDSTVVQGDPARVVGKVVFRDDGAPQIVLDRRRVRR